MVGEHHYASLAAFQRKPDHDQDLVTCLSGFGIAMLPIYCYLLGILHIALNILEKPRHSEMKSHEDEI